MRYIEAPNDYDGKGTSLLFLAGGITDCPDWQQEVVAALRESSLTLLNPRRAQFVAHEGSAREQIAWEHRMLRAASAILFWFPMETLCPIVLYELGAWSMTQKPIFVGVHPDYQRKLDVRIQTALVRPDVLIVESLDELILAIIEWSRSERSGSR